MYFPSLLQKYWVTGRLVSLVISFAAEYGSSTRLTQTLRVSLYGLRKEMYRPSGEIWAPEISGLPKTRSWSMRGAILPFWPVATKGEKVIASAMATRLPFLIRDFMARRCG